MPQIANRNAAIHYEVMGDAAKPAVALAHGRGGNTAIWFQQVPAFLKEHCVVVFDHRGFGRSRCADAHYDMAHFAITAPGLLITADNDAVFPPAAIREIARLIPGAEFRQLPAAGHSPYFETPQAWNAAVLEFLRTVG